MLVWVETELTRWRLSDTRQCQIKNLALSGIEGEIKTGDRARDTPLKETPKRGYYLIWLRVQCAITTHRASSGSNTCAEIYQEYPTADFRLLSLACVIYQTQHRPYGLVRPDMR